MLTAAVARFGAMLCLAGGLSLPGRDQEIYLRMAGRLQDGHGLSFEREIGLLKNADASGAGALGAAWTSDPGYVFGIARVETPTATIEPGYPILLALFFTIFGRCTGAVFLLNLLAQLGGTAAAFLLADRMAGRRAGLLAGLGFALYPTFVLYTTVAMTEAVHIAMIPLIVLLTAKAVDEGRGGFAAGATTGALFLVRSTALFLVPVEAAFLLAGRRFRQALLLMAGFALLAAPWVGRNWVEMGRPLLLPTKGALNMWMRNNPAALETEGIRVPPEIMRSVRGRELLLYPSGPGFETELERSGELGRRASAFMVRNPGLMGWLTLERALSFMSPMPESERGPRAAVHGFLIYLPILILAIPGVILGRRSRAVLISAAFFLLYLGMHAAAHGGMRYRLPVDSLLICLAASTAARWRKV